MDFGVQVSEPCRILCRVGQWSRYCHARDVYSPVVLLFLVSRVAPDRLNELCLSADFVIRLAGI